MNNNKQELIEIIAEQYEKFNESNKKLIDMVTSKDSQDNWQNNYHLIDNTWIAKWKETICFDNLEKSDYGGNHNSLYTFIEKNIKSKKQEKLNNQEIYFKINGKKVIDPMKTYYLISEDTWKLFDIKNENSNYDGNVSILKGNKKIIIKFDDNNYSVKFLKSENLFAEFIIVFNPPDNPYKEKILEDLKNKDINEWMIEVDFQKNIQQFTINKYEIPFDIKQKSCLFIDNSINDSKNISFSQFTFPPSIEGSFSSFLEESDLIFLDDLKTYRLIPNYKQTSSINSIIRCLSMIEPFASYFMNVFNEYKIFKSFKSSSLINLIKNFFWYLWSNGKTQFEPKNFFECFKNEMNSKVKGEKIKINLNEELDPIIPLDLLIDYINQKLNDKDTDINLNFNNIKESFAKEPYYKKLTEILNKNNTIIGQNFIGLILLKCECKNCKKNFQKLERFKVIDIDFLSIINHWNKSDDSIIGKTIESLLDFFFLNNIAYQHHCPRCKEKTQIINEPDEYEYCKKCDKIINNPKLIVECPDCKKDKATIRKKEILEYPSYLIIRLNVGEFDSKKGFINVTSDIQYLSIRYEKINDLKQYCSKKIRNYSTIDNYEYDLINMVKYSKNNDIIKFVTFCKSLFGVINKKNWIFFDYGQKPVEKDYQNKDSFPYILFYKFQKITKKD